MTDLREYILYELEHNSSPQPAVAVFGDLNLDTTVRFARFPLEVGDTMFAIDGIEDLVGGASANVASGLRALGNHVTFGAAIGTDRIGHLVLQRLAALSANPC